jgi:hypothetical protein
MAWIIPATALIDQEANGGLSTVLRRLETHPFGGAACSKD